LRRFPRIGIGRIGIGFGRNRPAGRDRAGLTEALEAARSKSMVRLKVAIPHDAAEELYRFLREKGLPEEEGIQRLILYGLNPLSKEEADSLEAEKSSPQKELSAYAPLRFKAYEYFMENRAITMQLRPLISENRRLKELLRANGLNEFFPRSEWDGWDEAKIEEYYSKYVFKRENRRQ